MANGVHQVNDALLPRDAANEQDVGHVGIDAEPGEQLWIWFGPVLIQFDAIVNDAHAVVRHSIERSDRRADASAHPDVL